jgi:hypothetical protein
MGDLENTVPRSAGAPEAQCVAGSRHAAAPVAGERGEAPSRPWFDHALACANGHLINDEVLLSSARNSAFCSDCGEGTLDACLACGERMRGRFHAPGRPATALARPPRYCHECGEPYPWTKERLEAARQLADEVEGLSPRERQMLKESLPDLLSDNPRSELAAVRAKRLIAKSAKEGGRALGNIVLDLASETAKRVLLP